ncbi:hypothetical protein F8388_019754 [Cannabis sativa]|uniref:TLC domain-containing protein n=1 Tax=Cannabis sativa TaxID=3483 RepID=A0A7J6EVN5_CANSA|nr:hypothetical protein F8388_019754 [Cannabis sativa]KAF4400352.1 hypothetical protein G4B88_018694 [Cannabis sativa]
MMAISQDTVMAIKSYQNHAGLFVKSYLLADPFLPYTSVLVGIFFCKLVYDLTQYLSAYYFKNYASLTKIQQIEWNNRGISSVHAVFITVMSLHFVFLSDLFSDQRLAGFITFRSSPLSTFTLGSTTSEFQQNIQPTPLVRISVHDNHQKNCMCMFYVSVGYFIADLTMILWLYPSLGGLEYVLHHSLSGIAVAYSMFSGEGQLYTFMILISEITTPEINIRWYLDTGGMKRSIVYLINGVVARIVLFGYVFDHIYLHYSQVVQMHIFGYLLVMVVPSVLAIMNLMWFGKILKGLKKQLAKRQ